MFKRFSVSEDVSTQTSLKSSAVRALKKAVADALPAAVAGAGAAALEVVLPPARKGEVLEGKGRDRTTFVILDGVPLFFKARDGPNLPTLRLLHAYPLLLPRVQTDAGAIKFVLGGANIMCRGLTSAGGALPVELPAGAAVAVYAEGKAHAIAIGTLALSTADIRALNKGIAIEVLHFLGDDLWKAKDGW